MRIRDQIIWRDYFWWTILIVALAGQWLIPYLLSRELIEPSTSLSWFQEGLSIFIYPTGGICFIGALIRPRPVGNEFSWRGGLIGSLGLLALFGSLKLLPFPWELGKFHFLKAHCQAQTMRDFAKWCRNQYNVIESPKAETNQLRTMFFAQPSPCPELTKFWGMPTCNFHQDTVVLIWSEGLFSRRWGLLVMDDPSVELNPPAYYREWEPGMYFWMQR